jgi:hypothetical protein
MRLFTLSVLGFLFLCGGYSSAQDIVYSKSTFDQTGDCGTMVTPEVNFFNGGTDSIEVFVNRFHTNLPANWTSCFCFINCHPPTDDTLRFTLAPGENATIGVGFNTDANPGMGVVRISIEQIGGNQKDTLSFSGSTMLAGINEISNSAFLKFYPNPVSEKLVIKSTIDESYSIKLCDMKGRLITSYTGLSGETELPVGDLSHGEYLLTITYTSGKTETQKIIKN